MAEVWKLRSNRREAINRVEQLRAELRESETARLRLSLQLEGLREEQSALVSVWVLVSLKGTFRS